MNYGKLLSSSLVLKLIEYVLKNTTAGLIKELWEFLLTLEAKAAKTDSAADDLFVKLAKQVLAPFV